MEWNVLVLSIPTSTKWFLRNDMDTSHHMYCNRMEYAMYQIQQYAFPVYSMDVNNSSRASQLFSRKMLSVGPFYTMYGKHSLDNMLMVDNED